MGGLRQRSLWDALRGLWVRFIRVGVQEVPMGDSVALSVETLGEGTSIAGCSSPYSERRAQGFSPSGFLLFYWCPSVSLIPTYVLGVSSSALSTHFSMPLRGAGSTQAQSLCFMAPSRLSAGGHSVSWFQPLL